MSDFVTKVRLANLESRERAAADDAAHRQRMQRVAPSVINGGVYVVLLLMAMMVIMVFAVADLGRDNRVLRAEVAQLRAALENLQPKQD